jgi:hypothetical protein
MAEGENLHNQMSKQLFSDELEKFKENLNNFAAAQLQTMLIIFFNFH